MRKPKPKTAEGKALDHAIQALKVIHTWATFRDGEALVPEHVEKLCQKTLKKINGKLEVA